MGASRASTCRGCTVKHRQPLLENAKGLGWHSMRVTSSCPLGILPWGCRMEPLFSTENWGSQNLDPLGSSAPAVERTENTVGYEGMDKSASLTQRWSQEGQEPQRYMKSRLGCH